MLLAAVNTAGVPWAIDPRRVRDSFFAASVYNDYMLAKSEKAFRRAALLRSKTAGLFCQLLIAMSVGRIILRIIRHPMIIMIGKCEVY